MSDGVYIVLVPELRQVGTSTNRTGPSRIVSAHVGIDQVGVAASSCFLSSVELKYLDRKYIGILVLFVEDGIKILN